MEKFNVCGPCQLRFTTGRSIFTYRNTDARLTELFLFRVSKRCPQTRAVQTKHAGGLAGGRGGAQGGAGRGGAGRCARAARRASVTRL